MIQLKKQNRNQDRFRKALRNAIGAATPMLMASAALAAPQGAQVVNGNVNIQTNGATTVIQASNNAIINYTSFNIATNETVQFIQPSATSRVLNRVNSANITSINGSLLANGHVYILNPAGVFFGGQAVVDVNGLTAAAGSISNSDFISGTNHFTNVTGSVVNAGTIQGNAINLIGARVQNLGTIIAPDGVITMAAGDDVYLTERDGHVLVKVSGGDAGAAAGDTPGVENTGTVDAGAEGQVSLGAGDMYALAVKQGGTINGGDVQIAGGAEGVVQVEGEINASDVKVLGDKVLLDNVEINALAGNVLIGGDYQGGNGVQTAERTYVGENAVINADGGNVIVWSDGTTAFTGTINNPTGLVEVSGKGNLLYFGNANAGTLLLDPTDLTIDSSATVGDFGATNPNEILFGDGGAVSVVGDATLNGAGGPIILQADNDVTFAAGSAVTTGQTITVNAGGDIVVDGTIAALSLDLSAGDPGGVVDPASSVSINNTITAPDFTITNTGTGGVTIGAAVNAANTATINNTGASGTVALNANINSGAGTVIINAPNSAVEGNGASTIAATDLTITAASIGTTTTVQTATGTLTTDTSAANGGQVISDSGTLTGLNLDAGSGAITLSAGGAITDADGAAVDIVGGAVSIMTAAGGVGAVGATIDTQAGSLSVDTSAGNGDQFINETDGVTITALNAGTGNVQLTAGGAATGGANVITATGLELLGAGSFNFGGTITTLAGNPTGDVTYTDADGVNIGTVNTVGLTSGGAISLTTLGGGINVDNNITATTTVGIVASGAVEGNAASTVTGTDVSITAASIGTATTLDTAAGTLTTDTSALNGNQVINETDGLTALNLNAGTGNVTLTAGGAITDGDGAALDITGFNVSVTTTAGGIGAVGATIDTQAGSLSVDTSAGNGDQFINETDGVTITALNAGTGNVQLTAGGAATGGANVITATGLELLGAGSFNFGGTITTLAGNPTGDVTYTDADGVNIGTVNTVGLTSGGAISVTAGGAGDINVNQVLNATGTNTIVAGGAVEGGAVVTGTDVSVTAASIGTGTTLDTTAGTLTTDTSALNGNQIINETNGVTITALNAGTGNVQLTAGGAATGGANVITATGLELLGAGSFNFGGTITTLAGNATGDVTYADADGVDIGTVNTVGLTSGGAISVTAGGAGDINVNQVLNATGTNTIVAGGAVEGGAVVTGTDVSVTAASIGTGTTLDTTAGTLTTDTSALNGNQIINETNGLTALNLNAGTGDVTLTTGGAITDADGAAVDITGGAVSVTTTAGGVGAGGAAIDTTADSITVDTSAGNGDQFLNETDGLTITALDAGTGSVQLAAGGAVTGGANVITATGLELLGAGSFNFGGTITTLAGNPTGDVTYTDADGVDIGTVNTVGLTSGGAISVTAGGAGDINVNQVLNATGTNIIVAGGAVEGGALVTGTTVNVTGASIGTGITLDTAAGVLITGTAAADGNQVLNNTGALTGISMSAGNGNITLTNDVGITDTAGANDINANVATVTLTSGDFGTTADPIGLSVTSATVDTSAGNGNQFITNSGGFAITSLDAGTGSVQLTSDGAVTGGANVVTATGLELLGVGSFNFGGTVTTLAGNATGAVTYTDTDGVDIGTVNTVGLTSGAAISVTAGGAGDINVGQVLTGVGVTLDAGTNAINTTAAVSSGAGDISMSSDTISLGAGVSGTGTLLLQPTTPGTGIGIGAGAAGGYNLDVAEIGNLADGFSGITIGRADGTGAVDVQAITFTDPITIQVPNAGGSIAVNGAINVTGAGDNILLNGPGATTTLNNDITTNGGDITISDNAVVGDGLTVNLTSNDGDISITGTLNGTAADPPQETLNIDAGTGAVTPGTAIGDVNGLNLTITAGTINIPAMSINGGTTASFFADILNFPGADQITGDGTGTLTLGPSSEANDIRIGVNLGAPVASTLDLVQADFDSIANNALALIRVGYLAPDGTGAFEMGTNQTLTFRDPMEFRMNAGTMLIDGTGNSVTTSETDASLSFFSSGGTTLDAGINAAGSDITINDNVILSNASVSVSTGLGSGNFTITGTLDATAAGAQSLSITAGQGDVDIQGDIGVTTPIGALLITSANDVSLMNIGIGTGATPGATLLTQVIVAANGGDAPSITFGGTMYNAGQQSYNGTGSPTFDLTAGAPTVFANENAGSSINFMFVPLIPTAGTDLTVNSNSGTVTIDGGIQPVGGAGVSVVLGDAAATAGSASTQTISVGPIGTTNVDSVSDVTMTVVGASSSIQLLGDITTGDFNPNNVIFNGPVDLNSDVTITTNQAGNDGAITFNNELYGNQVLITDSGTANTTFEGAVGEDASGASDPLNGLTVNVAAPGTINVNGGLVRVQDTADIALTGNVLLDSSDSNLTFGSTTFRGNDITVNGVIEQSNAQSNSGGENLTFASHNNGVTTLNGEIGGDTVFPPPVDMIIPIINNLTTNADGTTILQGNVSTTNGQTYSDDVTLMGDDLVLTDSGAAVDGGGITFGGTLDGDGAGGNNDNLTINVTDDTSDTTFTGAVGATNPLNNLTITDTNNLTFSSSADIGNDYLITNAVDVTHTGALMVGNDFTVTMANDVTLSGTATIGNDFLVTMANDVTVTGAATVGNDFTVADANDLLFSSTAGITGNYHTMMIAGDITHDGTLTVGGSATIDTAVDVSTMDVIVSGGNFEQTAGTGDTAIAGDLTTTGVTDAVGGDVLITTDGQITISGTTTATGGAAGAGNPGQNGGTVTLTSNMAGIGVGAINTSGSAAAGGSGGNGGDAGDINLVPLDTLTAGTLGMGDNRPDAIIILSGNLTAEGGAGDGGGLIGMGGDINLAVAGRASIPSVSTIFSSSDLIVTGENFTMGQNEKLSVKGDFEFTDVSMGGTATLGDINSLGDTTVSTGTISLLDRIAGVTVDATNQLQADEGLDFIAGGVHDFNVAPTEANGSLGITNFSNPDALGDVNNTLVAFPYRNFGSVPSVLFGTVPGGDIFDFNGTGPSLTNVSEVLASVVPRPEQTGDVIRDTAVGQAQAQVLADMGIFPRDLTAIEFVWFMSGRGTFNDLPANANFTTEERMEIARNRLLYDPVAVLVDTYRAIFFVDAVGPDGSTTLESRRPQVKQALQGAFNSYQQASGGTFDPAGFRQYLQNNPDQTEALAIMNGLREIFRQLELLGIGPAEARGSKQRVLADIVPQGLTSTQFIAAINAATPNVQPENTEGETVEPAN